MSGTGLAALGDVVDRSRQRAGFTIVELMVVVVIIGIMAIAGAPAFSATLADSRQRAAAVDMLRVANNAQALALASGVAHLLRFQGNIIQVYAGLNGRCSQTPWETVAFKELNGHGAIETFDMSAYNPIGAGYVISAQVTHDEDVVGELWICYQPNGETWSRQAVVTDPVLHRQLASYRMVVSRRIGSRKYGIDRELRFFPGASPWTL